MIKSKIIFILILLLFLQGGSAFAESVRQSSGFFSFGKNGAERENSSNKEIIRQKRAKKAATLDGNKHAGLDQDAQDKDSNATNNENANLSSKKSRMTLEEKRALRRQIHDAGNDIYVSPK